MIKGTWGQKESLDRNLLPMKRHIPTLIHLLLQDQMRWHSQHYEILFALLVGGLVGYISRRSLEISASSLQNFRSS